MATFRDLKAYVEADGWREDRNQGRQRRRIGDHVRYSKRRSDGSLLRTMISHALGADIGPDLFHHILRDQLEVDEATFWAVVRGRPLERAREPDRPPPLPGWLVQRLVSTVGLPEEKVQMMSAEQALAAWEAYASHER